MKIFCSYLGIMWKKHLNDLYKEFFRKSIHMCTAFIPFLLKYFYTPVIVLLCLAGVLYTASQFLARHGIRIPVVSLITDTAARKRDEGRFVLGPLTLVTGIVAAALLWCPQAAAVGILALAFGDGLASLAGKLFGTVHIPGTGGKTVAGSLVCMVAIYCESIFVLGNAWYSILLSFAGMLIEVLPLKDFDNVLIPVLIGGLAEILIH